MFHEGAIVSLYEGQIRFIRPELDASEPNAHIVEKYAVSSVAHLWYWEVAHFPFKFNSLHPQSSKWPSLFTAQRIFWPLTVAGQNEMAGHCQMAVETIAVPGHEDRESRALIDFQESQIFDTRTSARSHIVQDWDELSGRLCIRSSESRLLQDLRTRRMWQVTLVDFV